MNNISETIKALRKQNDMSQEQLAESLFVSRQAISKWERGEAMPDIENLASLSQLFGVSVDNLISGENILNGQTTPNFETSTIEERKLKYQHIRVRADIIMIISIMLYIINPFIFIIFDQDYMLPLFGIIVAIATGLIIYSNTIREQYKDLVGISDEEEQIKESRSLATKVSAIVGILATITFLYLGFFHGLWHPGWIVFLLTPLSRQIVILFEKQEDKR